MIVTACFLNPNYRSFKFGTEDEKKDFNNVSKAYLLKLYKTHYSSYSENEPEKVPSTPFSAASNESFFCKESTEETSESKSNLKPENFSGLRKIKKIKQKIINLFILSIIPSYLNVKHLIYA